MGTLLAIDTANTAVLAIVSALSVPVPAQREGENEVWIAELGLVGELWKAERYRTPRVQSRRHRLPRARRPRPRRLASLNSSSLSAAATARSVRVGSIRQDSTIPAMVRVDELLGKHFAILGTTGTGKSCTTALILRSILEKNPAAHIVLLDPHNEYATAFSEWAEVISPRNMQLPFWLLTFEELVEVLIGDPRAQGRDRDPAGPDPDRQEPLQLQPFALTATKARRGFARSYTLHGRYAGPLPHLGPRLPSSTTAWASSRTSATSRPTAT